MFIFELFIIEGENRFYTTQIKDGLLKMSVESVQNI